MNIGLSVLLALTVAMALLFASLYLRERSRRVKAHAVLVRELAAMAEPLAKVSFGILSQKMETPKETHPDKNIAEGLAVIRANFNRITSEPLKRLFYIGTDAWLDGIACARCIGEHLGGKGTVAVVVTSSLSVLKMAQRYRSFVTCMAKEYPGIRVTETMEAHADAQRTRQFVRERAAGLDALYVTGNSMAGGAAQGIADAGRIGSVFLLCHDLDESIVKGLRDGIISATVACSSYAQGRDSVIGLFNHIVSAWKPIQPRMMVELKIVRREDIGTYWDESAHEPLRSAAFGSTGIAPIAPAQRETRILVFCEDWNQFVAQTKTGVAMAADLLRNYNACIIEHTLNQVKRPAREVVAEAEAVIAAEKAKGLHGIVSFVGIEDMVPVLNRAAAAGIPIATFDSEPLSLRSMIQWLLQSAKQLDRFSGEYEAGHQEIDQAMRDTLPSIEAMVDRANEEARLARDGADSVAKLSSLIDRTSEEERGQTATVQSSAEIADKLSEMVAFLETRVEGLRDMGSHVRISSEKAQRLRAYSDKIQSIIGIIDDIAERTNILAFNAAIEATHAGDKGRGFKVISGEIRSLADKSVSSTRDIALLIDEMRRAISDDIEANARSLAIVEEQISLISDASSTLAELSGRLLEMMSRVRDAVERNTRAIEDMRRSAQSMNQVVSENSRISTDNSAAMESIGGAFTEISAQFAEMNRQTAQLKQLVTVLEGTVSAFSS
jgi:methyl-accepting chemotaxis protein